MIDAISSDTLNERGQMRGDDIWQMRTRKNCGLPSSNQFHWLWGGTLRRQ